MKKITSLLIVILFLGQTLWAAVQLPTNKISISFTDLGVRSVLVGLLADSGLTYKIDPKIDDSKKITFSVNNMKWNEAFMKVLKTTHLRHNFDKKGTLYIKK